MSYSIDFRVKVISTREEEGLSIRETAKQFRIGPASVSRWINQIASKASTTRQRKIDKSELIKDVEQELLANLVYGDQATFRSDAS
ncbi:IS630 transposase-related protein [Symbiopectobacterium sp. RP]|uniref:IS630 transposase-related protein n=1 Tax=Symbiopectobacterium sp. RP TaxID=3248553 RepID=UPI003D2B79DB